MLFPTLYIYIMSIELNHRVQSVKSQLPQGCFIVYIILYICLPIYSKRRITLTTQHYRNSSWSHSFVT